MKGFKNDFIWGLVIVTLSGVARAASYIQVFEHKKNFFHTLDTVLYLLGIIIFFRSEKSDEYSKITQFIIVFLTYFCSKFLASLVFDRVFHLM